MELQTSIFGTLEYDERDIISFESGLYGFEDKHSFLFIPSEDDQFQFNWLQSVEDPELVFIVTDPFLFVANYDFEIEDGLVEQLKIKAAEDLSILSIVNVGEDVELTTVNIKAPIIINHHTKIGKQIILDEAYGHKHYIFKKELNEEV
jgi:flagellar assembly factor FliW